MGGLMGQRHRRLVAASCCIWLLTIVALVSGQDAPDVTELRRAAEQGDANAQFSLGAPWSSVGVRERRTLRTIPGRLSPPF